MSWYRGTAALTNGSNVVTGVGTQFIKNVAQGFGLIGPDLRIYEVDAIASDLQLTLVGNYAGPTNAAASFAIFQTQGIIAGLSATVADMIDRFVDLREAYENGELIGAGLQLKGVLESPDDLPVSGAKNGDTYLVGYELYVWVLNAWQHGSIRGAQGEQGETGPAGVTPRGEWNAGVAYAVNDLARFLGSQYRRLVAGTSTGTPSADATNWELFVSRGVDGLGSVSTINGESPDAGGNVVLTKANLDLDRVDNTADTEKPVSVPQQQALDLKVSKSTNTARTLTDFSIDAAGSAGLNLAYRGGAIRADNETVLVAAGVIALTNNAVNFVEVSGDGVVSANLADFTSGQFPMLQVTTAGGAITAIVDKRAFASVGGGGGAGSADGFYRSSQLLSATFICPSGESAMRAGPLTVPDGMTLGADDGGRVVIV